VRSRLIKALCKVGAALPACQLRRFRRASALRASERSGEAPAGFAEDGEDWLDREGRAQPSSRRSLREAVRILREGREALEARPSGSAPAPVPQVDVAKGAGFYRRRFVCNAGARDYRLYIPALVEGHAHGLVVMLHGCTQSPDDFAVGTGMNGQAQQYGLIVAYPEQSGAHSAMQCWNWYRPGDQMRGAGEPAIIASLARTLAGEFGITRDRVFVAGLSAGGAMAAILGETYPDVFEAVGIHSGIAAGSATDMASGFAAMRGEFANAADVLPEPDREFAPRMIVFHGDADRTVHPANAERIVRVARRHHPVGKVRNEEGVSPNGRPYHRFILDGRDGVPVVERWNVGGVGHAWSGGKPGASYTDPAGPDASAAMIEFFLR
jgi:poly(hydroxyalkanoate) depolymerase family esterase